MSTVKHMSKNKELKKWIRKLDEVYSHYVRLKNSRGGIGKCYTCGKFSEWKYLQCGHFHTRTHMATRWDEDNTRVQCVSCNMFKEGNKPVYAEKLRNELGEEKFDMLNIKKNNFWKPAAFELGILTKEYQNKIDELSKVHG